MINARVRQVLQIDRTGRAIYTTELLPDASFEDRMAELKASLPDGGPRICAIRCDGCGFAVELDYDNPCLPSGWTPGDFCPACSKSRGEL